MYDGISCKHGCTPRIFFGAEIVFYLLAWGILKKSCRWNRQVIDRPETQFEYILGLSLLIPSRPETEVITSRRKVNAVAKNLFYFYIISGTQQKDDFVVLPWNTTIFAPYIIR